MVFFIDEARSRPPPRLLTNVNKKMVFFIEGFPNPTRNQLHSPPGLQHERAVGEREPDLSQPDAEGAGDHVGPRVQHQRLQQQSLSTS